MAFDFSTINPYGADVSHFNPTFAARMQAAIQAAYNATGQWAQISTPSSAFRDYANQQKQWNAYVASGYRSDHLAARPGHSLHEQGMALDLADGRARDW